ncbi:protein serine/threonine phosphatase 2C [Hymenopellis radicata]|nr:protein serine/threonine phosphatase 2C [Hymenopellis radicata]
MYPDSRKPLSNAKSHPITVADGPNTFGTLNQRPSNDVSFQIGVHEEQGHRPTMEDTHAFVVDFDGVRGQGFFGVFDGHGNKEVAEWCGMHFHNYLLDVIHANPAMDTTKILKKSFQKADDTLQQMSEQSEHIAESGSTAVVAFLRFEDADGSLSSIPAPTSQVAPPVDASPDAKRILYCANAGDARGVLCRNGTATRLTQDHKASDKEEESRIRRAGGIVFRGRVFGTLAISRSLGDHLSYEGLHLKELVIGTPYISRTELNGDDELCIIACDGLWDVLSDQEAVDLVRNVDDAQKASELLVKHALEKGSTDNCTVLVVRFKDFTSR